MHDLIPLDLALPGALTTAEIDATMAYAGAEKALATRRAYQSDWVDFAAWCLSRGATPLPAHVGIVAAYLSSLADSGRKASTIGRRAAGRPTPSCAGHCAMRFPMLGMWLPGMGASWMPLLHERVAGHRETWCVGRFAT